MYCSNQTTRGETSKKTGKQKSIEKITSRVKTKEENVEKVCVILEKRKENILKPRIAKREKETEINIPIAPCSIEIRRDIKLVV